MVNDKLSILEALISSNNNVWGEFHMHPLKTNMRLATAAAAQTRGGFLSQEEEQLRYANMLIDISKNHNSLWCQVLQEEDENIFKLGFPFMKYFYTEADHKSAVEWLYPGGQLDFSATFFCSNNASVNM
jgi:hypothetical protein